MTPIIGCLIGLVLGISASAGPLVEGWVRLNSGKPVAGAQVLLFDLTDLRSAPVSAVTDETGYFALALGGSLALPEQFDLGPNYPNPFNPSTVIPYQLPTPMQVRLEVFNILGQRVATLVDGERPAGFHTAHWDATDAAGRAVAAGVYLYRLSGDGVHVTRSMVLIDGQAGKPTAGGPRASAEEAVETAPVYGLTVSGEGLVPYVNPAFQVTADRAPVALVVETLDSAPPSVQFAPSDEQTFNNRMVGNRLHAETFFIDFVSNGRFNESGSIPGSYQYSNTGPNTGTLTLTYDGEQYGGGCALQLTFTSATTGTLHYTCNSGTEGRNNWHISAIGAPPAPQVVPRSGTDTELEITFRDFFAAGETRAYDFQLRTKTPQESWLGVCNTLTNSASTSATVTITLPIVNLNSGTVYEVRYRYRNSASCDSGSPDPWSEIGEGATSGEATDMRLEFPEGESTTRSIPENTPAGINVGAPVSAVGGATLSTLTYTISGPDAWSFVIVPQTGQLRTREGVTYDYEEQNRYTVAVGVDDDNGNRDTIEVTIQIENLVPACELWNLRVNHSDQRLTVRWSPPPEREGQARVLGYETEIRRGDNGPWTDRRTFLGRNINAMIYADLDNEIGYQIRARPINVEGDCGWSAPVWGIPTGVLTPRFPTDRFGTQPVGTPDRNWRFLTQERCRHTSNGVTLDANCEYENTGPNTGRIFLDFDDPSRGSCEVTLAYSSLTAGSFIDECFDAGVNTEVPFDLSFRMPDLAPQTGGDLDLPPIEAEPQRAPRNQDEFDALVYGKDDFIPGLCFGNCLFGEPPKKGVARMFNIEANGDFGELYGDYTYESTGPSEGVLTWESRGGAIYVFNLDFEPSGNVRITTTDFDGNVTVWPGSLHVDLTLGAQPMLLPIPPSWSAITAIETDVAPENWRELEDRIPTPSDPEWPDFPRFNLLQRTLLREFSDAALGNLNYPGNPNGVPHSFRYQRLGHNRATVTFVFEDYEHLLPSIYNRYDETQEGLNSSTWVFDLTFTSDGAAQYTLTITKEGELPTVAEGIVDFTGDGINLDEFPNELTLPDDPPQESGEDLSGVEVAAAITTPQIGANDVQTFLVSNAGVAYSPGDWLEPKDGGNQRMMIVGAGQFAAAKPIIPSDVSSLRLHQQILKMQSAVSPHASPVFASAMALRANRASQPAYSTTSSTITQLSVVCMQKNRDIPTRGARYFSQPKPAQDAVQLCQQNCVLNEIDNIQECVWNCGASAGED